MTLGASMYIISKNSRYIPGVITYYNNNAHSNSTEKKEKRGKKRKDRVGSGGQILWMAMYATYRFCTSLWHIVSMDFRYLVRLLVEESDSVVCTGLICS